MHFIEANGVGLRYELYRQRPRRTVVLIHEMGGSLESWDEVAPRLGARRRVLRYDTRGAGLSEKVRGALSIDTMVDDLAALMDALGITGKVALAGIAVGGAIALHAAARLPQRISAAVVGSPAIGIAAERRAAVLARVDAIERNGMRSVVDELMANGYPPELRADAARFAAFRARWLGNDPASYAAIYRMLAGTDLQAELARSPVRCWCSAGRSTACAHPRWPSRSPAPSRGALRPAADRPLHGRGDAGAGRSRHRRFPGRGRRLSASPSERRHKLVRGQSWNRPNPLL